MKKLLSLAILFCGFVSFAQNRFVPLESWPYWYENFVPGKFVTFSNQVVSYDLLNINIIDGKVHYVTDDTIMQADMNNIKLVRIGQDLFLNKGNELYKILYETEHGAILLKREIDVEEMNKSDIGYGKSAVASTQSVNLYAIDGGDVNKKSLTDATLNRHNGRELALREKMFLYIDGNLVRASRQGVTTWPMVDSKAVKAYLKQNKVKWKDVLSLAQLTEFLYGELTH